MLSYGMNKTMTKGLPAGKQARLRLYITYNLLTTLPFPP